jgi:hypothetical protein
MEVKDDRGLHAPDAGPIGESVMSGGSWPYSAKQCPYCVYVHPLEPYVDDSGYEIRGFCRHPRIAMELFAPRRRDLSAAERCRLFVAGAEARRR